MKCYPLHTLIFLILIIGGIGACSKLEEEGQPPASEQPNPEEGGGSYIPQEGDTLTVTQALKVSPGDWVAVKGYIVGYINGTAMSKAVFGAPMKDENTNIIIANTPDEQDHTRCMPIQLEKGSAERARYNLLLYPELLGKKLLVEGALTTYFRVNGFKHPNLWIQELIDDTPPNDSEDSLPEPEPQPNPEPTPEPASETPTLDPTPQENIYGR